MVLVSLLTVSTFQPESRVYGELPHERYMDIMLRRLRDVVGLQDLEDTVPQEEDSSTHDRS